MHFVENEPPQKRADLSEKLKSNKILRVPGAFNPLTAKLIEGGYYAVIKYSGRTSDKNFIKHKNILKNELVKNNVLVLSQPIKATYNGPFTLPIFRRNEVMFKVNF